MEGIGSLIETDLTAAELKQRVLQDIEQEPDRVRTEDENAPRTIDLDIALFADQDLDAGSVTFGNPDILRYAHVAVPLADIAPERRHPATGQALQEIAQPLSAGGLALRPDAVLWPESVDKPIEEGQDV